MGQNKRPRWKPTCLWSTNLLQGSQNTTQWEERIISSIDCWENLISTCRRMKLDTQKPTKIRLKPKPSSETTKSSRGWNMRKRAPWRRSWQLLFDMTHKGACNKKWKLTKWIKEKTKNILHDTSNNQQNDKTVYRMGEYVCKPHV